MRRRRRGRWWVAIAWALLALVPAAAAAAPASPPNTPLSASDWRSDLEFARVELPKRHVNLFHTLAPADYDTAFDRLLADLGQLAEHEIVVRLAEIVASVGDGHSRLTLPVDPEAGSFTGHTGTDAARVRPFRHLPLRLAWTANGYVVTQAEESLSRLLGARLIAIDGHEVSDVEARLGPVVQRDNDHQLRHLLPSFMVVPEVLHARGVSLSLDRSTWLLENERGRRESVVLTPVPSGATVRWESLRAPDWPAGASQDTSRARSDGLWFADVARPAAVYVRIAEIADAPGRTFAEFARQLETHLATSSQRRLIVDLRGNPGGDNSLNAPLVRALIRTSWVSEPGALVVLVDGATFSAAMNLAEDLEWWLPAIFVGTGTGARPNTYGDARKLVLPRSGLTVRLSSLYWQNHPNDRRSAIEPLIPAVPGIADLRAGRDPVETVLEQLDDAGEGSISLDELGVDAAAIRGIERTGAAWRGEFDIRETRTIIAGRAAGGRLTGWIEYRGSRYPFVLTRP